jgi:hypothetical protein
VITPSVSVCVHPDKVPGPPEVGVPAVIASTTVELSFVTVLPDVSWTVTCGCVANATFGAEFDGCLVKTSFAGGPNAGRTVNCVAETAVLPPPSVTEIV